MKAVVAVVGRPNVGKSTLFNRLVERRVAVVEDQPGITRDRLYFDCEWNGRVFTLVDTGGLTLAGDEIAEQVQKQARLAIDEANVVLFIVDGRQGVLPEDEAVADLLRKSGKPVLLAVNKIDDPSHRDLVADFYRLGIGDPIPISAIHGLNTGDLLDAVVDLLPEGAGGEEREDGEAIRLAFIGRPNVGKSSLVNALLGQERMIVSDVAGTTRDAVDVAVERDGQRFVLIDTAGMRRRAKVRGSVEHYSVIRGLRAIDRSNVVILVIDAVDGVTEQDKKIAGYAHESGKGLIIAVNKWDLVEKDEHTMPAYEKEVRWELSFVPYAPVVFVSAKTGQRVSRIPSLAVAVDGEHRRRVPTPILNDVIREAVALSPPPAVRGRLLKIYYGSQPGTRPPTFVFSVNDSSLVHFSYQRYLENRIREAFGFDGTPISLQFRGRRKGE